jgi:hypothetical protein
MSITLLIRTDFSSPFAALFAGLGGFPAVNHSDLQATGGITQLQDSEFNDPHCLKRPNLLYIRNIGKTELTQKISTKLWSYHHQE